MIGKQAFDSLYRRFNRRDLVHPDPLEFLYAYCDAGDREVVGLIASSLAYGRVAQILKSVRRVLDAMGESPRGFLLSGGFDRSLARFNGFKHRFTDHSHLGSLLTGARRAVKRFGSLDACFASGFKDSHIDAIPAMSAFVREIGCEASYLLPSPEAGSACKRLNLFLRWMVRHDDVDPGGWKAIQPSKLIVPVDTHMAQIARLLGITSRKAAGLPMAMEITEYFRGIDPSDPVKYDFALTRFGIRSDMDKGDLLEELRKSR